MGPEAGDEFCYVTTTGRRTGKPHTIEIWYARSGGAMYVIAQAGERADWVRNLLADPSVVLRVGGDEWVARARPVHDEEERARAGRAVAARYQGWTEGSPLPAWLGAALPVALEPGAPPEDDETMRR